MQFGAKGVKLDFYSIAHLDRRRPTPNPVGHIRGVRTQVAQYNLPFCPQEAYTLYSRSMPFVLQEESYILWHLRPRHGQTVRSGPAHQG